MSTATFNTFSIALMTGAFVAFVLAAGYLIAALVGPSGPARKKRLRIFGVAIAVLSVLIGSQQYILWRVFLPSLSAEAERERQERPDVESRVRPGDLAPVFALKDINEREFSLQKRRGKVVLVSFFATWCEPCLMELPHLQEIWESNQRNDQFAMILVGRDETNDTLTRFQTQHQLSIPMAADPDSSIFSQYATEFIPRNYLIAADGKICFSSRGFYESDLQRLRSVLATELERAASQQ